MPINVSYSADPRLAGEYAYQAGVAEATRENLDRTIQRQAAASQYAAGQATQRQGDILSYLQNLNNQNRQLSSDYLDYLQSQNADQRYLQQEAMQQQAAAERQRQSLIARGLKDGTLYYSQEQKNRDSELGRKILAVASDPTIDYDLKNEMIDAITAEQSLIRDNPMVQMKPHDPTPMEDFAGKSVQIGDDGRILPVDPTQPVSGTLMTLSRSGQWQAVKNPREQLQIQQMQKQRDLEQKQYAVAYKAHLDIWKAQLEAAKSAVENPLLEGEAKSKATQSYQELLSNPPLYEPPGMEAEPVKVNTPEELAALPPGTKFIAPDNSVRYK